jgi:hypothetical protein
VPASGPPCVDEKRVEVFGVAEDLVNGSSKIGIKKPPRRNIAGAFCLALPGFPWINKTPKN